MKRAGSIFLLLIGATVIAFSLSPEDKPKSEVVEAKGSVYEPVAAPRAYSKPEERELILHTSEAYDGFTVVPESGSETVHIIDMKGRSLHQWNFDAARARLLPNCNLLVIHGTKWGLMREPWRSLRHFVREYDWDGNIIWEYKSDEPAHHDLQRLPNGNTLFLHRSLLSPLAQASITDPQKRQVEIRSDTIREVTRAGETSWLWTAEDHVDPNSCGSEVCRPVPKKVLNGDKQYDWTHANSVNLLPENQWFTSGDTRFTPGNLLVLFRNWSQAVIIDKESGEIVWHYHGDYKGGLSGGHEAIMVEPDLPGNGNILIFDNGRDKGTSFALEINPVTKELVWKYDVGRKFYSLAAGSLQRLPNGNTLIAEDYRGITFEVTPENKRVWEIHHPYRTARPQRYEYDHCPQLAAIAQ